MSMLERFIIKMNCKLFLIGLAVALINCIKVDTNNSLFVDEFGRYRIYHGVNVVYKT